MAGHDALTDAPRAALEPSPTQEVGEPIIETGEGAGLTGPAFTPTAETVKAYWNSGHSRHGEAVDVIRRYYELGGRLSGPSFDGEYPKAGFGLVRTGFDGDRPSGSDGPAKDLRGVDAINDGMACPANAEGYDVTPARAALDNFNADRERQRAETVAWNGEMENILRETAHAAGLGTAQMTGLSGIMAEMIRDPASYQQRTARDANERQHDPAFMHDVEIAKSFLHSLPNKGDVIGFLRQTGMGDDARVIRLLARQAERMKAGKGRQRVPRLPGQGGISYRSMPAWRAS